MLNNRLSNDLLTSTRIWYSGSTSGIPSSDKLALSQPFTNFDFLAVDGCNDNGQSGRHMCLHYVPIFITMFNSSTVGDIEFWYGSGGYWAIKGLNGGSTTSTLKTALENSVLHAIYGLTFG